MKLLEAVGRGLATFLAKPRDAGTSMAISSPELLANMLQKGDVLLVEGSSRFSTAIKYLTQSSWSHAAIYVGAGTFTALSGEEQHVLIDVDVVQGVRSLPLSEFSSLHTRICRPVGLHAAEIEQVVAYAVSRLGQQYNLKNIIDLARYLIQTPPVSIARRRRMLAFCSGDPSRAICSTLIAQAFQSVRYPILPDVARERSRVPGFEDQYEEILHIRHHSLFAPRDFDVSPYFVIVKPILRPDFDPHTLHWADISAGDTSESFPPSGRQPILSRATTGQLSY
jgi:cell wall-associated NlpC family hydrolase